MMPQRAYVLLPRHTTSVERGMRKYSTVRASANEFGGMMQTSDFTSPHHFSSKFFGSTIIELMFVTLVNSFATPPYSTSLDVPALTIFSPQSCRSVPAT